MSKMTLAVLADKVVALEALVAQLVAQNTALEQRASNFAARTTHVRKVLVAEITRLRDRVENGAPRVSASAHHVPSDEWNAALAMLKAETGVSYHAANVVRGKAMRLREQRAAMIPATQPDVPSIADIGDEDETS